VTSKHIHKRHNKTLLLYHLVFPAKYRRKVFTPHVTKVLRETCIHISECYEIFFVEIGTDKDHVHFLVQSIPMLSITQIVTTVKSISAKQIFIECPEVKKLLWGGNFWTSGYYANTVGQHGNEKTISNYVKNQGGGDYTQIHRDQLKLFEGIA